MSSGTTSLSSQQPRPIAGIPKGPDERHDDSPRRFDRAALRWIAKHLDDFAPPGVLDDDSQAKPLLELVVLMIYRLRGGSPLDSESVEVIERLTELAGSPALREKAIVNRNQLVLRAGMCTVLRLTNRRDRAQERHIQAVIDTGLIAQSERLPHHIMIERTVLDWGGFRHQLPRLAELAAVSMLVREPDALYLTRTSAYELTHDIMFGYTFGEREATELASELDRLHRLLTDALFRFQREGHWDLVGELLMCWDTLKLGHDGAYEAGWKAFAAMQHVDGSIPAIEGPDTKEPQDSPEAGPDTKRFVDRYHTTLVLLFAATTRARRETEATLPATGSQGSATDQSATSLDAAWLNRLVERCDASREPRVLVSSLIGLTLLEARDPAVSGSVPGVVARISDKLLDPGQLATVPATQTLTAYGILRDRGVDVPAITGFVDAIRTVVTGSAPDVATTLSWLEKLVVLSELGLAPAPPLPPTDDVWQAIDRSVGNDLADTWELAGACTGYGTAPRAALTEADELGVRRLEELGVDALRRRDLIAGCALIRGAHALRPLHHQRLGTVTTFLRAQQSPDGGYGSITPPVGVSEGVDGVGIDVDADARLPISLAVWWTLAELNTSFRMFSWDRALVADPPVAVPS